MHRSDKGARFEMEQSSLSLGDCGRSAMNHLKAQVMFNRVVLTVLAFLSLVDLSMGNELRIVNYSGLPICITLVSRTQTVETWIENKTVTDIPISIDDNERVLIIRHAEIISEKRLAKPIRVMATRTIKTSDAKSGCIFVYLHDDEVKKFQLDLLCLGSGRFVPFDDTEESEDSFARSMKTLLNDLRFSASVNVNASGHEQY